MEIVRSARGTRAARVTLPLNGEQIAGPGLGQDHLRAGMPDILSICRAKAIKPHRVFQPLGSGCSGT
jgi:hypothetical protein